MGGGGWRGTKNQTKPKQPKPAASPAPQQVILIIYLVTVQKHWMSESGQQIFFFFNFCFGQGSRIYPRLWCKYVNTAMGIQNVVRMFS